MLITSWLFLFVSIFDLFCFFFSINDCHHRKILYTHTPISNIDHFIFILIDFFSWNIENLFVLFLGDFNLFTSGGHTMVEWLIIFFFAIQWKKIPIQFQGIRNDSLYRIWIIEFFVWLMMKFVNFWFGFHYFSQDDEIFLSFSFLVIVWLIGLNSIRGKNSFDCFAKQKNISWFAGRIVSFYFLTIQRKPVKFLKW